MKQSNTLYSRYGLSINPFRLNAIDSNDLVRRVHANLSIDDNLALLKEEVFFKKKNHNVFLIGDSGTGKTHRVLIAHAEAEKNSLFSRLVSFSNDNHSGMFQFLNAILPKGSALLSNDKWQREIAKLKKQVKKGAYDPHHTAQIVADALNVKTPSFILIDNLDEVQMFSDNQSFFSFLFAISSLLNPGVLLMITMTPYFASVLTDQYPQGVSFFKMQFIEPLTDEDAEKIISKRMESYRLVHGLFPLFPFNSSAVKLLNSQSHGNTRCLVDLADMTLTAASYQKAAIITDVIVKEALFSVAEKRPLLLNEKIKSMHPSFDTLPTSSEEPSDVLAELDLSDSVVSVEPTLTPVTADMVSEKRTNVVSHSDLAGQIRPDEGGRKEQESDERIDENIPHSFSASPRSGIKKIDSSSGSSPHYFLQRADKNSLDDAIDSLEQGEAFDCSMMKVDDRSFVSSDDNGSTKRSADPANIMHQAKKQSKTRIKRNPPLKHDDENKSSCSDESCEKKGLDDSDKVQDCWQQYYSEEDELDNIEEHDEEPKGKNSDNLEKSKKQARMKKNENDTHSPVKQIKNNVLDETLDVNEGICSEEDTDQDEDTSTLDLKESAINPSESLIENENEQVVYTEEKRSSVDNSLVNIPQIKTKQCTSEQVSSDRSIELHSSLKRVLRVRCPECSKEFSIEIDEDTHVLTCPFCDFQGEF